MNIISHNKLKAKLDRGDRFRLVMTLDHNAFKRMHIPGSLHFRSISEIVRNIPLDEEIVVYCVQPECPSSWNAYKALEAQGYRKLYRYAGGLRDWVEAGYPVEVGKTRPVQQQT